MVRTGDALDQIVGVAITLTTVVIAPGVAIVAFGLA